MLEPIYSKNGRENDVAQERARDPAKAQIGSKERCILLPFNRRGYAVLSTVSGGRFQLIHEIHLSRHGRAIATGPTGPTKKNDFLLRPTHRRSFAREWWSAYPTIIDMLHVVFLTLCFCGKRPRRIMPLRVVL